MADEKKREKSKKEDIAIDDIYFLMSQSYENVFVFQSMTFKRSQGKSPFLSLWDSFAIFANS